MEAVRFSEMFLTIYQLLCWDKTNSSKRDKNITKKYTIGFANNLLPAQPPPHPTKKYSLSSLPSEKGY
jgi:hypothetical protein